MDEGASQTRQPVVQLTQVGQKLVDQQQASQPTKQPIILGPGTGPLQNVQVDQWKEEARETRLKELEAWVKDELKGLMTLVDQMSSMKKGVKIIIQTLEIKLAKQKVDLLRKMKKETLDGEGPYAHVATEFRRRLLPLEEEYHAGVDCACQDEILNQTTASMETGSVASEFERLPMDWPREREVPHENHQNEDF